MAKYRYVGDKEAPESTKLMGKVRFKKGGPFVEVTDERILGKLRGGMAGFISEEDEKAKKAAKKSKAAKKKAAKAK